MSFFRSIVLLTSVVLLVAFAYFIGHALSSHSMTAVGLGVLFLVLGVGLIFAQVRTRRAHP